ncbi:MAG: extracellular solute-binding protein [Firmicutes bacterium]|nr:extracellular solute-binding protein [Bacillota bacterium]
MKRNLVYILCAVALLVLIFGFATGTMAASSTTLHIYGVFPPNPKQAEALQKGFQAIHPDVTLKWHRFLDERFIESFMAARTAGEPIDVVALNGQDLRFFATSGMLENLTPFVKNKEAYYKIGIDPYTIGGKLWALPGLSPGVVSMGLYYNKLIFNKYGLTPPETYADMVKIARTLRSHNVEPLVHEGGVTYMWPLWYFFTFAQTSKNRSVERTADILEGKGKFTDADSMEAMRAIQQFAKDRVFITGVNSMSRDQAAQAFMNGKAAMWVAGSWMNPQFIQKAKEEPKIFQPGRTHFPILVEGVIPEAPGGPPPAIGIYRGSKNKDLAKDLVLYLAGPEATEIVASLDQFGRGAGYALPEVKGAPGELNELTRKDFPRTVVWLDWFWPPEITRVFQTEIQAVVGLQRKPEDAMLNIQKEFDRLVARGYKFSGVVETTAAE